MSPLWRQNSTAILRILSYREGPALFFYDEKRTIRIFFGQRGKLEKERTESDYDLLYKRKGTPRQHTAGDVPPGLYEESSYILG